MGLAERVRNANWKGATILAMLGGLMSRSSSIIELRSQEEFTEHADMFVSLSYLGIGPTALFGVSAVFVLGYSVLKDRNAYNARYYRSETLKFGKF